MAPSDRPGTKSLQRDVVIVALQWHQGRTLCIGQQRSDAFDGMPRRMQQHQLGFAHLDDAVQPRQQQREQVTALIDQRFDRPCQHRFAMQDDFGFFQLIGSKGGAAGNQVTDDVSRTEPGRNLDRAG